MRDLKKEVFKAIYLDTRNQIIDTKELFEGTLESIPIRPRDIIESVIKNKAAAVILSITTPQVIPLPARAISGLPETWSLWGILLRLRC